MTIRPTGVRLTGTAASLLAGTLLLAVDSQAAPRVGGPSIKSAETMVQVVQGKVSSVRPSGVQRTVKPPTPRVRDPKGAGWQSVGRRCGFRPRPCPRIVRDPR